MSNYQDILEECIKYLALSLIFQSVQLSDICLLGPSNQTVSGQYGTQTQTNRGDLGVEKSLLVITVRNQVRRG